MAAQALMKRGKRAVATYFRAECSRASGNQQLNELLDHLLDVSKLPTDPEILDWLRWLIAGGTTFDEFSRTVNQFDNATTCGLVWTANFVAYRCRTCGISPCMSLCSDCFQAGNHTGHDYNMFRSQAGGACDCGDTSVMKACGFCPRHGPDRVRERSGPPPELLATAEAMMPRLLFRLIQHLRLSSAQDSMNSVRDPVKEIEGYMDYLHSLSDMGAAMRHIITKTVTNTELYTSLCQGEGVSNPEIKAHLKRSQDLYKQTLGTLNSPRIPKDFQDMKALSSPLVHQTLLDELLFWTVKLEFPQLMVTFLLSILPDSDYKEAFTISFVKHYSRMSIVLVNTTEWPTISNRVVHISVQLLSPENLAMQMVEEHHLLYLMTICLEYMMKFILTDSTLHEASNNFHMVVDCSQTVMREHCYWPIVSDLINVLSHRPIAYKFMSNERLLKFWFELISYFQGMNLNQRELQRHVEYEPDTYYAAFSAELEICSSPMWSMLVHCPSQDTVEYTKKIINMVIIALRDWFLAIGCRPFMTPNPLQLTFHLPLHRYLAVFLGHAVRNQGMELMDMLPSQDFLQLLIIHPLQIQMCLHQIFANMWVRNGLQIRGQAMTYIQCHFCNSMVDADIFLLQVCACKLDPDFFIKTVLDRFSVLELFSLADHAGEPLPTKNTFLQPEHMIPMLEGALTCLVSLLSIRTNLGMTEEELACLEMITLLCMSDRTHSQLMDYMPEKCGLHGQTKNFEPTLKKVAEYKAPNFEPGGGMQQGMYVPKGEVWEDLYDPVYVLLRAVHRRDFQQSMDRYTTYVKQAGLYKGSGSPWPPFRLPGRVEQPFVCLRRLLHSRSMHALIFILLYKAVNESKLSETVVYLCCYLLEMAITTPAVTAKSTVVSSAGTPRDKELSTWYASDNIFTNLQVTVEGVTVKVRNHEPPEEELTDDMDFVSDLSHSSLHPPSLKQLVVSAPRPSTSSSHSPGVSTSGSSSSTAAQTATQTPMPGGSIVQSGEDVVSAIEQLMDQAIQSLGNTCRERPQFTQNKGVSASLGEHVKKASVKLEESILSLLCKLHKKLSGNSSVYVPESIRGSASFEKDSRIGDGPFFIAKMLDRAARLSSSCSAVLEDIYRESQPRHTAKKAALDPEEKKRRARARQQKLMAEFASKQKQFMEQLADESGNLDDDGSSGASVSEPVETQEQTYDCVICNQTTPSTQDKPMALVTLLQSTSVLGHRVRMSEGSSEPIPDGTRGTFKTCAEEQLLHHERLFQHFQQVSVLLATSIGWEGGVHAQSCGHYVHLDCHKSYMESLLGEQAQQQNLLVSQGEFLCPLCRKLSNSVVAIVPDLGQAIAVPVPSDQTEMVLRIADILQNRPVTHITDAGSHSRSLEVSYARVSDLLQSLGEIPCCDRTNLELEIMLEKLGDKTLVPGSRKQSLLPLLHVLGLHYRLLATNTSVYKDLWLQVTGVTREQQSNEVAPYLKKVPLLLTDPCALLVQLVLSMPPTMEVEYFQCIVQALYNLAYIQALIVMSCKFSPEERTAWSGKAKEVGLEGLMGLVVQQLTGSELYRDITPDPHIPAITHVWSPQSVECTIQQHCLPYLRLATHLQCHLYGQPLPVTEEKLGEYLSLCQHAGLCRDGVTMDTSGASSVRWLCSEPVALIQAWSGPFLEFVNSNITSARMLLMCEPMWQPPRLCHLPRQYDRIFQYYRKKQCTKCNTLPHDPALCLMCARVLCFKHVCCAEQGVHECVKHSVSCGGGTGILLIVNSSLIVVIRGPRATVWGSVYLDEFGEEDRDLKRGKPLYLSEERYKVLQQQWLAHSFDQMCKRWIFHNDRL